LELWKVGVQTKMEKRLAFLAREPFYKLMADFEGINISRQHYKKTLY